MKNVILIVEDNQDIREILAEILASESFDVLTASTGVEALAQLDAAPGIDLVILDWLLPEASGWDLLAEIRSCPTDGGFPSS
jgi:DNA-binding response OmpR family regulator